MASKVLCKSVTLREVFFKQVILVLCREEVNSLHSDIYQLPVAGQPTYKALMGGYEVFVGVIMGD